MRCIWACSSESDGGGRTLSRGGVASGTGVDMVCYDVMEYAYSISMNVNLGSLFTLSQQNVSRICEYRH